MAMIERVQRTHFPYLPLTLRFGNRRVAVEALLDTGFDGDVIVPAEMTSDDSQPDAYLTWALADGSPVQAPDYLGTVQVGPFDPFDAVISVLGDESIVGRSVTDRFRVILDHGQQVIVER